MGERWLDIQRVLRVLKILLKRSLAAAVNNALRPRSQRITLPVLIRSTFEELGVTFLKLGQFLALRFDILPPEMCRELQKLFEDVAPVRFEEVRSTIEAEFGRPLEEVFPVFNREPLASASVAQVHEAQTVEGVQVAVKVQRAGILEIVKADLRNLHRAALLADLLRLSVGVRATLLVKEFRGWTMRELDFTFEAQMAERLRADALPYEIEPAPLWELTTHRVFTMEFITGLSMSRIIELTDEAGPEAYRAYLPNVDLRVALHHVAYVALHQMFITGLFHGDLHPGNVIIRDDNTVGFVDFGIVGEVTPTQRRLVQGHYENLAIGNIDKSFDFYAKLWIPTEATDMREFAKDAKAVLRKWYEATLKQDAKFEELHWGTYADEAARAVARNKLRMDIELLLFFRSVSIAHASLLLLGVDFLTEARDFFTERGATLPRRILAMLNDPQRATALGELVRQGPGRVNEIIAALANRRYELRLIVEEQAARRASASAYTKLVAAGLVSISLIAAASSPQLPLAVYFPAFAVAILILLRAYARVKRLRT